MEQLKPSLQTHSTLTGIDVRVIAFSLREESLHVLLLPTADTHWTLPGSQVASGQSLEETATNRLFSLTSLREAYLEQLYTYGEPDRHPDQRLISVAYFALVPAGARQNAPYEIDASSAKWFPVTALPALVDDHADILVYALRRLRYKLEYSAVGFQLLPEDFTLSELQKTYEMILGEKLDKRNFRRRILEANIIEPTPHLRSGEGRPARLYRYRPDAVAEIKTRRLFP